MFFKMNTSDDTLEFIIKSSFVLQLISLALPGTMGVFAQSIGIVSVLTQKGNLW